MRIRLCLGEYAKVGYEPEGMDFPVFSVEELCFFIRENLAIVDEGLMDEELILWLDEECRLPVLAEELRMAMAGGTSLKAFVDILLTYTGFFSGEEKEEILSSFTINSGTDPREKQKAKADALLERGKVGLAGKAYEKLLEELEADEWQLRSKVYHSCGVCLARLFYFQMAAEYFLKAYELGGNKGSLRQHLLSLRLSLSEEEYLKRLQEKEEFYEAALRLEQEWGEWEGGLQGETKEKEHNFKFAGGQEVLPVCPQKLQEQLEQIKEKYREMVSDGR